MNNILRIPRGEKTSDIHGAIFPEKLPIRLMQAFSKENDLIYDPFMGSGTSAIASIKLNRRYIGSEISPEYCKIANDSITNFLSQTQLF